LGAFALGMVALVVWLDTRGRMRRKLEKLERQRAVEEERARIARDIHDELGSSLTRITMLSEPTRQEMIAASREQGEANQIYDIARRLTHTMDEIVWAVNPQHDTLEGLVNYLEKFALDFLGLAGVRCRLDLPMQLPACPLTAETRHNLFLAFKEALHNAVKHAASGEVRISLRVEADTFTLGVEDYGCGFDMAAVPLARNGLENMRKRLTRIGGWCELSSATGQGTKILFIVPMTKAGEEVSGGAGNGSAYRKN